MEHTELAAGLDHMLFSHELVIRKSIDTSGNTSSCSSS
ncbi:protein of unknown function [Shewanella benthica]|uniref:Uncharacterized protein n=1 Tax=Shewanella benthica TaxID=43661 RepID=A0A330LYV4_9GAMM|nr:protein of unknown function [Shewanella benthica]